MLENIDLPAGWIETNSMVFYKNTSDHILINEKDTAKITLIEAFF